MLGKRGNPSASGAPREEELLGVSGGRAEPLHEKSGCFCGSEGAGPPLVATC